MLEERFPLFAGLFTMPVVATDVAPFLKSSPPGGRLTLRAKGILACIALLAYILAVGAYVTMQREKLLQIVQRMDSIHQQHEQVAKLQAGLTHSIVTLQYALNSKDLSTRYGDIHDDLAALIGALPDVAAAFPSLAVIEEYFERQSSQLGSTPSRETLAALLDAEQQLMARLQQIEGDVKDDGDSLSSEYEALNQYITVFVSGMNLLGLAAFGIVVAVFLSRLAADLNKLQKRAMAIVSGYRGPSLETARGDEVGRLMTALDRMQSELREREQRQEISRQQRFHQEKMAAVGSLAAAVAHEVSNPINSISGIAQYTIEAVRSHRHLDEETLCGNAELTLRQTERIGSIMRRLADLSGPRSSEPELIDLNELVKITCNFVRYDRRLRHVELVSKLDQSLPAVRAVADHLTQILMNLLINSADALEGVAGDKKPVVEVSTSRTGEEVVLSVSDNGHGMDPSVRAHAFEESFTTKPAGKGRGIGLYLCKTLIEEIDGRIELESTPGTGTTARVRLPVPRNLAVAS
jgi:signal transduction histidine kinase